MPSYSGNCEAFRGIILVGGHHPNCRSLTGHTCNCWMWRAGLSEEAPV